MVLLKIGFGSIDGTDKHVYNFFVVGQQSNLVKSDKRKVFCFSFFTFKGGGSSEI